jgi:hypothetical protein
MDIDVAEKEALTQLSRIEENLEEIKERTPSPKHAFINGIWQGAGVVLGTIVALLLLGWVLSVFGVIPGFGGIVGNIKDAMTTWRGR